MKTTRLLVNGHFSTLDPAHPRVEALALQGARILASGDNEDILAFKTDGVVVENLHGANVLPGFTDSHIHLQLYAHNLAQIDCETDTREACLERVRQAASRAAPGTWIRGHGWNQNRWDRFGTREELDQVAPGNPVYLTAKSLHAGWANSQALALAGVDHSTADPARGRVGKSPDGSPSGILFEDAMQLVSQRIPPPAFDETLQAIAAAQEQLLQLGITAVHDFDGPTCFRALNRLREEGLLRLRVLKHFRRENLDELLALGLATGIGDSRLRIGNLKLFADGALGPQTAAMLEPYEGGAGELGMLTEDRASVLEIGRQAAGHDIALAVHAIGDRANREVLDALEILVGERRAQGLAPLPHRMEHLQLLHPQDVPRPASLGITASMQPLHAVSDMDMADEKWGARVRWSYAWNAQLAAGARLIFGSDAPVESPNPYLGLHAALTRRKPDGSPGSRGWVPEERITIDQAIQAYTRTPHEVAGWGASLGSLRAGYLADLVVLPVDPAQAVDEWLEIKPTGVMVDGEWIVSPGF